MEQKIREPLVYRTEPKRKFHEKELQIKIEK